MWSDNETNRDFLNFQCVADTAAEMIVQAQGSPLSMGVSGGWGAGKSSMMRLISDSLEVREGEEYLFVEFNAWLYQGFDDARAALMEVIAERLVDYGEKTQTGVEKAKALLSRVNWLRVASLTVGSAASLAAGLPPVGLLGAAWTAGRDLANGVDDGEIEAAEEAGKAIARESKAFVGPAKESSPPRRIHDLRRHFEKTLEEMGVTLVVFIDDLDRCLPATAIATLEAIRLFLFLPGTAFVIAADDRMIREAVRVHFAGVDLDDDLVTNYFDKLVQVPLRVPPLGTQEVRAYLMLLFVEKSDLDERKREEIREAVCRRLSDSWKGGRVDLRFFLEVIGECPDQLRVNLELADRLAPLMTRAKQIAGNPRLIKRFLNTLAIRLAIGRSQGVTVDEGALAKMILFERCARPEAYSDLVSKINDSADGRPLFLEQWERKARAGERVEDLPSDWGSDFVEDWLALPPSFAGLDLRAVVYVSREHLPVITAADTLSSEAAGLLEAVLGLDRKSQTFADRLRELAGRELALIGERLLVRARQEQDWGTPPVLFGLLTLVEADPEQAEVLARFLAAVPPSRLQPDIVPLLAENEWATPLLESWRDREDTPPMVKKAIKALSAVGE